MYTIQQEVGHLDKLKIGLVGDLANGRTVRSLAYLLSMYDNVKMYFVAPDVVRMKDDIKEFLTGRQVFLLQPGFVIHMIVIKPFTILWGQAYMPCPDLESNQSTACEQHLTFAYEANSTMPC